MLSSFVLCLISTVLLSLSLLFMPFSPALASIFHFEGSIPDNLGVNHGFLSPCPSSPNCVVSQNADETHYVKPITYQGDRQTARETLLKVLSVVPNTVIVEERDNYIRTESRSKIMGFVDDAEFYFPDDKKVIQIRSASRLGESDLGVNRRRLEQIRLAMADLNSSRIIYQ
jgi:uncharacterized protein (DUF1499 family)